MIGELPEHLCKRQIEVLQLIADGYSNKLIAGKLDISYYTTRGHVANMRERLDAYDMAHAVAIGFRRGIIT